MHRFARVAVALALLSSFLPAQLRRVTVASGFSSPLYVTSPVGDKDRLFVVERGGTIRIIKNGTRLSAPYLNIISRVRSGGERGLLGLAFHPDYANNGKFYCSFTRTGDGRSVVEEYEVSPTNPDVAIATPTRTILPAVFQPFSNHNGGCIQFGPDGYLYVGLGDGGSANDPGCRAQRGTDLLGKMLRLDVDSAASTIPATNPFVGNPAVRSEIWAVGLRNPWRFSFDRETGDMYIGDVGQNSREEISFQPAASMGGENYGWKIMEGNRCFSLASCPSGLPACNSAALTDPIYTYATGSNCSITGGYVYRGCAIPSLRGTYFFGDYCSGTIWSFEYVNGRVTNFRTRTEFGRIGSLASFGEDDCGELYMVSLSGTVFRIESTVTTAVDLGNGSTGSNGLTPSFTVCGLLTQGETAEFRLDDAPANQSSALIVGSVVNPTPFPPFGTLVPTPQDFCIPFTTDADGKVRFTLPGGTGNATAISQYAIFDPGLPSGVVLSNALSVSFR